MSKKKPPMRTSEDVIHRFQHDDCVDRERVVVGYLDRFLGVIEKKFNDFVWCKVEMASVFDLAIPKHRIEYFKYHSEVVWSKKDRIDKVFGSSNSDNETILDVVERLEPLIRQHEEKERLDKEAKDAAVEKHKGLKSGSVKHGQGLCPTHFICIPFQDPRIKQNVHAVQSTICAQAQYQGNDSDRVKEEACISLSALHMTLLMLRLPTPEAIARAANVFREMGDLLETHLPRHLLLTFRGVKDFGGRVVYTEPMEHGRLAGLVSRMKERFVNAGVSLVGNHDPYQPHMTIAKLNRGLSRDWNGSTQLDHAIYGRHENDVIGTQACLSLQLCELYADKHPHTGFYRCLGSLTNVEGGYTSSLRSVQSMSHRMTSRRAECCCDDPVGVLEQALGVTLTREELEGACCLVIMRGLPGCGKSLLTERITAAWENCFHNDSIVDSSEGNGNVLCVSADNFMYKDGKAFTPAALSGAHARCLQLVKDALRTHQSKEPPFEPLEYPQLIILDNTNTTPREYEEYVKLGKEFGVRVGIVEVEANVLSDSSRGQNISCLSLGRSTAVSRGGVHGVPDETIEKMWSRWIPDVSAVVARRELSASSSSSAADLVGTVNSLTSEEHQCQYIGVVLDEESRQALLEAYPPRHPSRVRAHHCTLAHVRQGDIEVGGLELGQLCEVRVYGEIQDEVCQGVVVETVGISRGIASDSVVSGHITISHDPSVAPKHTADLLAANNKSESVGESNYRMRQNGDALVLKGIVSACVTPNKPDTAHSTLGEKKSLRRISIIPSPPVYISHPADVISSFQVGCCSRDISTMKTAARRPFKNNTSFTFDFVTSDTRKVCIFDLDDTLIRTPSKNAYESARGKKWKRGRGPGWFSSPDSLSLSYPMPAANSVPDFFDQCGRTQVKIIILTGRLSTLQREVEILLASRGLLLHTAAVVCKPPSASRDTAAFKGSYVAELMRACPQLESIECWDDKWDNLESIKNAHRELRVTGRVQCDLEVHLVSTDKNNDSRNGIVRSWAERSGGLATAQHKRACEIALENITQSWHTICDSESDTEEDKAQSLVHVFGSCVFDRRSDVDVVLNLPLTPSTGHLADKGKWMDLLHNVLKKRCGCDTVVVYKASGGRIPKMAIMFKFFDLPCCELDVIVLPCESKTILLGDLSMSQALNMTIDDIQRSADVAAHSVECSALPTNTYGVLYGIAVRNTCLEALRECELHPRDMGALICAARHVVEGAAAMGTCRRGVRPYLLALGLSTVMREVQRESYRAKSPPGMDVVDNVFLLWIKRTLRDCKGFPSGTLYPPGAVEQYHLNRLATHIKCEWCGVFAESDKDRVNIKTLSKLNTLEYPNNLEYSGVHISLSEMPTENGLYFSRQLMVGILSKYSIRLIQDGHQLISMPPSFPEKYFRSPSCRPLFLASFGISVEGAEVLKSLFTLVHKDFENATSGGKSGLTKNIKLELHIT